MQPQDPVSTDNNEQQPEWYFLTRGAREAAAAAAAGVASTAEQQQQRPEHEGTTTEGGGEEESVFSKRYRESLQELAAQTTYYIDLQDTTTGQKIVDPFDRRGKTIIVFYGNEWETKEYQRNKITVADYQKANELSKQHPGDGERDYEKEEDRTSNEIDAVVEFYKFLALCYLRMTPDEFDRADWGYLKAILDACQYRTVRTLPKFSRALHQYFHLGKAKLNEDEYEAVKIYRLWSGRAKTKPWEYNGGFVYEEDLNMVLHMEELDISGQNFRAKKEVGGAQIGADGDVHKKTTRIRER